MPDAKIKFLADRIFAARGWHIAFDTLPEATKREYLAYGEAAIKAMEERSLTASEIDELVAAGMYMLQIDTGTEADRVSGALLRTALAKLDPEGWGKIEAAA